jgi:hypothetical protein
MKSFRHGLVCCLLVAVLAGGWWNWRQVQRIHALKASLPAPTVHVANLKRLSDLRARIRDLQARGRTAAAEFAVSLPQASYGWMDQLGSPEVQQQLLVQFKAGMETAYGPLFRALQDLPGMTQDRLGQFKDLLLREQATVLQACSDTKGQPPQAMEERVAADSAASDQAIHHVLGDNAYAQYRQYADTLPQRVAVALVSQNLDYGAPKLTGDQTERLIAILAGNPAEGGALNIQSDATPIPNLFSPEPAGISKAALSAANGILSPGQIPALEAVRQQQQIHIQLLNWIDEAERAPAHR